MVECNVCGKKMKQGSLQRHMEQQHNQKPEKYLYRKKGVTRCFTVDVRKGKNNRCPVLGCIGSSKDKFGVYRHFCLKHPEAKLIIAEDGEASRCDLCGM